MRTPPARVATTPASPALPVSLAGDLGRVCGVSAYGLKRAHIPSDSQGYPRREGSSCLRSYRGPSRTPAFPLEPRSDLAHEALAPAFRSPVARPCRGLPLRSVQPRLVARFVAPSFGDCSGGANGPSVGREYPRPQDDHDGHGRISGWRSAAQGQWHGHRRGDRRARLHHHQLPRGRRRPRDQGDAARWHVLCRPHGRARSADRPGDYQDPDPRPDAADHHWDFRRPDGRRGSDRRRQCLRLREHGHTRHRQRPAPHGPSQRQSTVSRI